MTELGLRKDQAALWAGFISNCLHCINHAEKQLKADWHVMLAKIANRKKSSPFIPEETDITKELYGYCYNFRLGRKLSDPIKYIVVRCEDPHQSACKTGKESERIDLGFENANNDLILQVEAKRLLKGGVADYLGESGVGVFTVRNEPRTRAPVGAMFGYVLTDCPKDWIKKINDERGSALPEDLHLDNNDELTLYSIEGREMLGLDKLLLLHRFADFTVQNTKSTSLKEGDKKPNKRDKRKPT